MRAAVRAMLMEGTDLDDDLERLLLKIDNGPYHMMPLDELESDEEIDDADHLAELGLVKLLPADDRFPDRLVLTGAGSHAIGTFDFDTLRDERHKRGRAPKAGLGVTPMVKI